jgi:hypothetical protein
MTWLTRPTINPGSYPDGAQLEAIMDQIETLSDYGRYAVKATATSRASTITLADDPDLVIALPASTVWSVRCTGIYVGNDTGDFRYAFTFPTGAKLSGQNLGAHTAALAAASTSGSGEWWGRSDFSTPLTDYTLGASTTDVAFSFVGLIIMSTTAGNLTLQWAQSVSNATNTTLKIGSHLVAQRVA